MIAALPHLFVAADTCSRGLLGTNIGPGLYDHLCNGTDVSISSLQQIVKLIANVVAIILSLAGMLGVVFLIVGGIFYVTSAGDPGRLKRAKDIIVNVVTGLIIVIAAFAIVTFISGSAL